MALTERIISTPNEIDRLIKARIEELRKKEKGLTQEKFAQRAGIPLSTYTDFLSGGRNVFNKHFPALVDALGLSVEQFLAPLLADRMTPGILSESIDYKAELRNLTKEYEQRLAEKNETIRLLERTVSELKDHIKTQKEMIAMLMREENEEHSF